MEVGMDVDVAAGVEFPRTYGSARRAEWFFGEVVRKVLSWNVAGNEFLSQSLLLETGVLKLGMTDVFHVVELIPRPKTMKDMNEPMRASY